MLSPVEPRVSSDLKTSLERAAPVRELSRSTVVILLATFAAIVYLGNAGFPGLLDDADASHAMVAREMLQRHDFVVLYMDDVRYRQRANIPGGLAGSGDHEEIRS